MSHSFLCCLPRLSQRLRFLRALRRVALCLLAIGALPALADARVTFLSSWFAQAEHSGWPSTSVPQSLRRRC